MTAPAFETRPGPKGDRYKALVETMKQSPGTWFKVRNAASNNAAWSAAHQIKTGKRAAFRPATDFEAYADGVEVIARYVGDQNNSGE